MSYQVNWEIQALDQTAGFLRDDPVGVAALWDTVGQLAEPHPPHQVFTYLDLASVDWLGDYATVCHLERSLVCRADLTDGGEGSRHLGHLCRLNPSRSVQFDKLVYRTSLT